VLVTGASSGIGASTARLLAAKGAVPVLLARRKEKLDGLIDEIGVGHSYVVDCGNRDEVSAAAARILDEVGVPDVLVNNAGAGRFLLFDDTEPEEFEQMMAAPYFAAVYVTRAFLPAMLERGTGHVVTVNAPIAWITWPHAAGYAGARWALRGFGEALRADLFGTKIKVTQVVAATVETEYFSHQEGARDTVPRISRIMRTLTPEDVAEGIVRGVEGGKRIVFLPRLLRAIIVSSRLFPRVVDELVVRTGRTRAVARAERENRPEEAHGR
jgi:short-subunit dehydrogenase